MVAADANEQREAMRSLFARATAAVKEMKGHYKGVQKHCRQLVNAVERQSALQRLEESRQLPAFLTGEVSALLATPHSSPERSSHEEAQDMAPTHTGRSLAEHLAICHEASIDKTFSKLMEAFKAASECADDVRRANDEAQELFQSCKRDLTSTELELGTATALPIAAYVVCIADLCAAISQTHQHNTILVHSLQKRTEAAVIQDVLARYHTTFSVEADAIMRQYGLASALATPFES